MQVARGGHTPRSRRMRRVCLCIRLLQDHGDRARDDPHRAPPPCVVPRGVSSTPPHAQRHPQPHLPHAALVRPLTMSVPMLLSG